MLSSTSWRFAKEKAKSIWITLLCMSLKAQKPWILYSNLLTSLGTLSLFIGFYYCDDCVSLHAYPWSILLNTCLYACCITQLFHLFVYILYRGCCADEMDCHDEDVQVEQEVQFYARSHPIVFCFLAFAFLPKMLSFLVIIAGSFYISWSVTNYVTLLLTLRFEIVAGVVFLYAWKCHQKYLHNPKEISAEDQKLCVRVDDMFHEDEILDRSGLSCQELLAHYGWHYTHLYLFIRKRHQQYRNKIQQDSPLQPSNVDDFILDCRGHGFYVSSYTIVQAYTKATESVLTDFHLVPHPFSIINDYLGYWYIKDILIYPVPLAYYSRNKPCCMENVHRTAIVFTSDGKEYSFVNPSHEGIAFLREIWQNSMDFFFLYKWEDVTYDRYELTECSLCAKLALYLQHMIPLLLQDDINPYPCNFCCHQKLQVSPSERRTLQIS
jgi:hypothetical protein